VSAVRPRFQFGESLAKSDKSLAQVVFFMSNKLSGSRHSAATPVDGSIGGQPIRNKILRGLPKAECSGLFSKLEFVSLPVRTVLNESGEAIKFGYFMNEGLASVLSVMADGKTVEVGLFGREGFVGLPLAAGFASSATRVIVQVGGSGFRVSAKALVDALQECATLANRLQRFEQEMGLQSAQSAACNRVHDVDERLARWLLMSQDRLGGDMIALTQEFLAHMLGTRRASVTVAAGMLQKAGLITYTRGAVRVESRSGLEDAACECYKTMTRQIGKWRKEASLRPERNTQEI
jgi:CRP-like cAMP-binding protein